MEDVLFEPEGRVVQSLCVVFHGLMRLVVVLPSGQSLCVVVVVVVESPRKLRVILKVLVCCSSILSSAETLMKGHQRKAQRNPERNLQREVRISLPHSVWPIMLYVTIITSRGSKPVHMAHGAERGGFHRGVETLGEGQGKSHHPDYCDRNSSYLSIAIAVMEYMLENIAVMG
ncbi:hypothetical protein JZ751_022407 [Albula glossodonta]|uniref:Uncharacterized protein n=1 Tax=Albula glossodonta TaxID=121402 RepID=A0A8T2MXB6_9TELE|nr:hypothetical protein JZ751_022407 [Albula glossodonta]